MVDIDWNTSIKNNNSDDLETFYDANENGNRDEPVDQNGEYRY
jgi:hypothetical protein